MLPSSEPILLGPGHSLKSLRAMPALVALFLDAGHALHARQVVVSPAAGTAAARAPLGDWFSAHFPQCTVA
jgi:hypothetical protein